MSLEGWAKVRDVAGAPLAWVERKSLSDKRMVVVKSGTADVLAAADPNARTVFRVEQNVLLELVEAPVSGWAVGDRLVFPDTRQLAWNERPDNPNVNYVSQTETATVAGV